MKNRHQLAGELFERALEWPPAEREAFVAREAGDDLELRREVSTLLAYHDDEIDAAVEPGLAPNQLLAGRYRLVAPIGEGGMGEVWRAVDELLGEDVAIKSVHRSARLGPLDEIRLARRVTHPNICRVHDAVTVGGRQLLAMELVEGEDLAERLAKRGRLPAGEAIGIVAQAAAGLAAAHAAGVIHRDLKPANLLIGRDGRVRLSDFGLAETAGRNPAGPLVGTPAYMAPELFAGQSASERSDVFALAVVLYEAIAGRAPIEAGSLAERVAKLRANDYVPLSHMVDDTTVELDRVMRRALAADPADRYSSILAFAGALPGCDPLQIAAVAGVAPPIELVTASRQAERWPPTRAYGFAAALFGALAVLSAWARIAAGPPVETLPPRLLLERAEALLPEFGYPGRPGDRDHGFESGEGRAHGHTLVFWYRRWNQPAVVNEIGGHGRVFPSTPPLAAPGDALLLLSPAGELLELRSVPEGPEQPVDPRLEARAREAMPIGFAARVSVAKGRVVEVAPVAPTAMAPAAAPTSVSRGRLVRWIYSWILPLTFIPLGLYHLRSGRGSARGALSVASSLFVVRLIGGLACAHHPGDLSGELQILRISFADALLDAVMAALALLAVEPVARRYWPDSVVVLGRVFAGRWRDPSVGASLASGALIGTVWALLIEIENSLGPAQGRPDWFALDLAAVPWRAVAVVFELIPGSVERGLFALLMVVALRALLRRTDLAALAAVAVLGYPDLMGRTLWSFSALLLVAGWAAALYLLVRVGILAWVTAYVLRAVLLNFPPPLTLSAWWSPMALAPILLVAGIALFGLMVATAAPPEPSST